MNIHNPIYKTVAIDWDSITFPLKAGTPIDSGGHVCNTVGAIGLVTQTVTERPLISTLRILIGGDVNLEEVMAEFGGIIYRLAMLSMQGLRFYLNSGEVANKYITEMIPADVDRYGSVKMAAAVSDIDINPDKTTVADVAETVNDLLEKLEAAGIMKERKD